MTRNELITKVINDYKAVGVPAHRIVFHKDMKHVTILGEVDPVTAYLTPGGPGYVKTIDVKAEPADPLRLPK